MIFVFICLFIIGGGSIIILVFFGQQFLSGIFRGIWQAKLNMENAHIRHLAKELEVVYQELAWKNKRLVDLSSKLRQKNEELSRHSEFQARLFAMVSHDLRNAVGSVYSSLAYLFQEHAASVSGPPRRYLDIAFAASEHVKYLSESLTEYISLKRDDIKIEKIVIDTNKLLGQILPRFGFEAEKKKIKLTWDVPDALPPLFGDPGKLSEVFNNLLHNAIKFTPPDGTILMKAERLNDKKLQFTVVDSGEGVALEEQERIFNEFYSAKPGEVKHKGWGLGLAIVKHIVILHGGTIAVFSEGPGKGATFTCTFPTHDPASVPNPAAAPASKRIEK